jgi:hypothetical protein
MEQQPISAAAVEELLDQALNERARLEQQRTLAQTLEQDDLRAQIADLRRMLQDATISRTPILTPYPPTNSEPHPPISTALPSEQANPNARRPRPVMPDPPIYTGNDPATWPVFHTQLRAKLTVDQDSIGSPHAQIYYMYSRLGGTAAQRILPMINLYETSNAPFKDPVSFLAFLNSMFEDPNVKNKAMETLNNLKQGQRDFNEFYSEFLQNLVRAGGECWNPEIKINLLERCLPMRILNVMVSQTRATDFEPFVRQCQLANDQWAHLDRIKRKQQLGTYPADNPTTTDAMDLTAGATISSLRGRGNRGRGPNRNQGSSRPVLTATQQAERDRRFSESLCLNCGSPEHIVRDRLCNSVPNYDRPYTARAAPSPTPYKSRTPYSPSPRGSSFGRGRSPQTNSRGTSRSPNMPIGATHAQEWHEEEDGSTWKEEDDAEAYELVHHNSSRSEN